jgi:hypothetical protein
MTVALVMADVEPRAALNGTEPPADEAALPGSKAENLYLVGRPTLKEFLRYVKSHVVDPPSKGSLTDEWHAANAVVRTVERDEAGLADSPPMEQLGPDYEPLLAEFLSDPLVRHGFNTVPTEVALVELDRLVVYQKHIDLTFVRQLKSRLGRGLTPEQVFRTCLLHEHSQPPAKWAHMHHDSFVFMSPSNDMRFLGALRLQPGNLRGYPPPGDLIGIVGLAVGFGSNFLNALYTDGRLILNNGSHRAYALRELGVTHVPCIVQHVSTRDQLDVVAASQVRHNPDLYLKHPRPTMLKDYFNPRLRKVMPVKRRLRQIIVRFKVEVNSVPAM